MGCQVARRPTLPAARSGETVTAESQLGCVQRRNIAQPYRSTLSGVRRCWPMPTHFVGRSRRDGLWPIDGRSARVSFVEARDIFDCGPGHTSAFGRPPENARASWLIRAKCFRMDLVVTLLEAGKQKPSGWSITIGQDLGPVPRTLIVRFRDMTIRREEKHSVPFPCA